MTLKKGVKFNVIEKKKIKNTFRSIQYLVIIPIINCEFIILGEIKDCFILYSGRAPSTDAQTEGRVSYLEYAWAVVTNKSLSI